MILVVVVCLLLVLGLLLHQALHTAHNYWTRRGVHQFPVNPLTGHILPLVTLECNESQLLNALYKPSKALGLTGLYYIWTPVLLLTDPALVKDVLVTSSAHFLNHPDMTDLRATDRILSSLFLFKDSHWKATRSLLSSQFSLKRLKSYTESIQRSVVRILPVIDSRVGSSLELESTVQRYAMNVITDVLFGLEVDTIHNPQSKFIETSELVNNPTPWTFLKLLLYLNAPRLFTKLQLQVFPKSIWTLFHSMAQEIVRIRESESTPRDDFLGLLLKMKNAGDLTLADITGHLFVFFDAGYDTTSLVTSYSLLELSRHHQLQQQLRDEVDDVLARHDGLLTYECLQEMPFMDMVIAETLRMYPPVGVLKRECTQAHRLPGSNVVIEPGTQVAIPIHSIHMDPEYFPRPEVWEPARHRSPNLDSSLLMAFGKGPRTCIGMKLAEVEVKIALTVFMSLYEFEPSDSTPYPVPVNPLSVFLTVKPKNGIWVTVKKRNSPNSLKLHTT